MNEAMIEDTIREVIIRASGNEVYNEQTLQEAGIDSLDRIAIESELECSFSLPNAEAKAWLEQTDTIKSIRNKINHWQS